MVLRLACSAVCYEKFPLFAVNFLRNVRNVGYQEREREREKKATPPPPPTTKTNKNILKKKKKNKINTKTYMKIEKIR